MNNNGEKNRIRLVFFGFVFFALILCVRLYYIQIIHGQEYVDKADRQYVSPASRIFDRGDIFFQNKDGSLLGAAALSTGYNISINPQKLTDLESAYTGLSAVFPLDLDNFYMRANQKNTVYQKIAEHLTAEQIKKVEVLAIPGLSINKERWRTYPGDSTAARTIGFVGYDGDALVGRYGLEKYYEDVLSRKNDQAYVNFFAEIFSNIKQSVNSSYKSEGEIVTSIEPTVEDFLEGKVKAVQDLYSSEITGGIIIDPMTGEVYAMAVSPTFDLNNFGQEKDISVFNNPLVEGLYEMGSIIKPLTMAAGIDTGAVNAETVYNDTGSITLDTYTISNYDKKARGEVNMQDVLNQSLNLGV